jgi:hypothetical protein
VSPTASYGVGWFDININGIRFQSHNGSIDGFKTEMPMLPFAGIGILIFTNSDSGSYFNNAMRDWVLQNIGAVPAKGLQDHLKNYQKHKRTSYGRFVAPCAPSSQIANE